MPEIIPNYHPLFVHFTIALLSISVVFYVLRLLLPANHSWREQWLNMANWSLWIGCLFAIATVVAGWFAYNSVAHDTPSHEAMTLHRNWALPTVTLFLLLGLSSINLARKRRLPGVKFVSVSIIAAILLMITGWLGAEVVYRYGVGVMALPQVEEGEAGHHHSHGSDADKTSADGHHHRHETADEVVNNARQHTHDVGTSNHENLHADEVAGESPQPLNTDHHNHTHDEAKESMNQQDGHNHTH